MRVAIDATPLLVRSAGVKNYLYYWIEALRKAAGPDVIRTIPALPPAGTLRHDGSIAGRMKTLGGLVALAASNYTPLPVMDVLAGTADVFHASVLIRRPPRRTRLSATIHDLTTYLMPDFHPAANRTAEERFADVLRRADGMIAVSQCTKDDAVRVLGLAPEKIQVIHSGVAPQFFQATDSAANTIRERYGLGKPFVLFVGTIEPRKNVDVLLDAFAALPAALKKSTELVVAGPIGWKSGHTAARLNSVRYLGYVPESDLAPLTKAAAVFAYPSLYEGFGFPVAQAMAAGSAVITSNISSLPEIAGDAAILVDPHNRAELTSALERLLVDDDLRHELQDKARRQAAQFRWEITAEKSLEFFRRLAC